MRPYRQRGRRPLHPAWTYTLRDLAGALWGVLVFAAALLAPGYCLGHLLDIFGFRRKQLREQLAWSVALSFGPGVLLLVGTMAIGGVTAGAILLVVFAVAAVFLARKHPPVLDVSRGHLGLALAVLAVWTCIVLGSVVGIGTAGRLWMSVTSYDHGLRTAFVDAVLRSGIPPVDPVYWPGHDVPMRYYYFWYAVCAAVARLAYITGRQALMASCVWPLLGVVAMLALFGRYVLGRRGRELTRLTATAAALMAVTGLDLLVTVALHLLHTPVLADMEWWSIDQVASWPDSFLWVPHHAAALVAALLGLLLLIADPRAEQAQPQRRHPLVLRAVLAGLCFAAAFGMSVYLAVGVAIVAAGWWLAGLRQEGRWRRLQGLLLAGLVAAASLSRFLWQLTRHEGTAGKAAPPLYFGIREILTPVVLASSPMFGSMATQHPHRARELAAAILLVPGWGVELGFYAIVLLAVLFRWRRSSAAERTLFWLTLSGLVAASFLRSGVIATNDYGIRSALLAQFFLLLLGALVFAGSTGNWRRFLWLLIAVGAGGCAYQLVLLRTYLPWQQAHGNPEIQQIGERTYALREAYAALGRVTAAGARVQFDPASTSFYLYPHLFFANRQIVTAEITCSTSFGGNPGACPGMQAAILQLFPADAPSTPTARQAGQLCRSLGAQYLVVTRWDAAWDAPGSWVWTMPAAVEQPSARVVRCVD